MGRNPDRDNTGGGRAAGETAPILFTAAVYYQVYVPRPTDAGSQRTGYGASVSSILLQRRL